MIKDKYTMEELSEVLNVSPNTMRPWCGHYTLTKFIKHFKDPKTKYRKAYFVINKDSLTALRNYLKLKNVNSYIEALDKNFTSS